MVRQRLAWTPRTLPTVAASPQLLSVLQSSPCAHRVHKAATGMSPSPLATPITARRLSEPFRYPARLMRCDWVCAASAQAVVPFIQPPVMYGVFPSRSRQGAMQDRVCVRVRHVRHKVVYVYRLLNVCCMYPFICTAVCVCGCSELVYHSGKDNHKLADGKSMPRWTALVCAGARVCVSAWPGPWKVPVPHQVCGK